MRWMKHLSVAHDDPALCVILEHMGPEGYGIYWLLLEHLAIGIEKDSSAIPSRSHSVPKWASICHTTTRTFMKFVQSAADLRLIESNTLAEVVQFSSRTQADRLQIDIPNLLKYRDEYSKKSGQCTSQMERREDGEQNRVKPPLSPADAGDVGGAKTPPKVSAIKPLSEQERWFHETFWPLYPIKRAKSASLKAAKKLSAVDRTAAMSGLMAQLPEMRSRDPTKIPHASTWINGRRWEDEPAPLFVQQIPHLSARDAAEHAELMSD